MNKILNIADDPSWTLQQWLDFIKLQIEKYGPDSIMFTDGGANNVELLLEVKSIDPNKKRVKKRKDNMSF